jgi:uncharacterized protein (DUF58 family)
MSEEEPVTWRATQSQARAAAVGFTLAVGGLFFARPDLVVLATPFVVVAVGGGGAPTRPRPEVSTSAAALTVHEGDEVSWQADFDALPPGAVVTGVQPRQRWLEVEPAEGQVVATGAVRIALRATHWGRRTTGEPALAAHDGWLAWRWGPVARPGLRLTVLPIPAPVDATAPAPHPRGLVGMERAARTGEGTEFAKVRPFELGDRLRRIHWPVSARTGRLHVTATYADEDAHVAILIDAINDVGDSTGLDGARSSMDIAVRAAAVLAEHFLRRGDRVGMRVFGAWGASLVPATTGRVQLRRILDTLSLIEPGTARGEDALAARQGLGAGTLALMLSPLIDPAARQQVAILSRAGIDVVVVDTLPSGAETETGDDAANLGWRLRMLERRLEIERLTALGIPVVPWRGPHSVDQVLRDITRRRSTPRLGTR